MTLRTRLMLLELLSLLKEMQMGFFFSHGLDSLKIEDLVKWLDYII